jgi:DNA-binding transcriptional MerR regulator
MTAGRSYLSIGDVLTLLRQEFPDVTISKIRFLESQGLVNPERTPSGYRKFYDHDVERLKWVLRQQREHFLPLKVIKGRLEGAEEGADGDEDESSELAENGTHLVEATKIAGAQARPGGSASVAGARNGGAGRPGSGGSEQAPFGRDLPSQLAGFDPSSHLRAGVRKPAPPASAGRAEAAEPGGTAAVVIDETVVSRRTADLSGVLPLDEPEVVESGRTDGRTTESRPTGSRPTGLSDENEAQGQPATSKVGSKTVGTVVPAGPGSRRFTAGELAAASGLSEAEVADLVSFGILGGRTVGGIVHYDESELAVAEIAAAFGKFGIEPRHLRLYKHSSEREAGFVEQLVLPLLKQRNPDARKRAAEMAAELTRLGQGLRAALVQRSLQDLLG